jgi:hypothetical protein
MKRGNRVSVIRQRTKNLIYAGLVGVLATAVISVGLGIYSYSQWTNEKAIIRAEYEQKLVEAEKIKQEQMKQKKQVLVAKHDIKAGKKLSADDFTPAELPIDQVPENIIVNNKQLEGKFTKIDISKNGTIIPSMLFEDGITPDDLRKLEYTEIMLPTKLKKEEYVDVRVNFPTGQDYIVLGKKKVKDLMNGTVWFDVNEQEILSMSSAVIDAYLNDAKIYALSYVDPYMQDSPIVNYPVNQKVLDLINTDPNLKRIAKSELSKNARILLDRDLDSMSAEQKQKISNARSSMIQQKQTSSDTQNKQDLSSMSATENNGSNSTTPNQGTTPTPTPVSQGSDSNINEQLPKTEKSAPTENSKPTTKESDIYKESVNGAVQP